MEEEKKIKKRFNPAPLSGIGIILMAVGIALKSDIAEIIMLITGFEFPAPISTMFIVVGAVCLVSSIIIVCIQSKLYPEEFKTASSSMKREKLRALYRTAEFVAAHKNDDGTYVVEYEYKDDDGQVVTDKYENNYSYIDAKYFQKVRRFTIAKTGGFTRIADTPRPGMIPELANAPIVPKETVEETKKAKNSKKQKEETEIVQMFCSYCDCMLKKNSNKCPHCGAPVRKFK